MEINRREFLAGSASIVAAAAAGGCASTTSSRPLPKYAYVGCYTTKQRNGRGEGISVHRIDGNGEFVVTGLLVHKRRTAAVETLSSKVGVRMHGQENDPGRVRVLAKQAYALQSTHERHGDVRHDDVRFVLARGSLQRSAVSADVDHVVLWYKQLSQRLCE